MCLHGAWLFLSFSPIIAESLVIFTDARDGISSTRAHGISIRVPQIDELEREWEYCVHSTLFRASGCWSTPVQFLSPTHAGAGAEGAPRVRPLHARPSNLLRISASPFSPLSTSFLRPSPYTPTRARRRSHGRLVEEFPRRLRVLLGLGHRVRLALVFAVFLVQAVGVVLFARAVTWARRSKHESGGSQRAKATAKFVHETILGNEKQI